MSKKKMTEERAHEIIHRMEPLTAAQAREIASYKKPIVEKERNIERERAIRADVRRCLQAIGKCTLAGKTFTHFEDTPPVVENAAEVVARLVKLGYTVRYYYYENTKTGWSTGSLMPMTYENPENIRRARLHLSWGE